MSLDQRPPCRGLSRPLVVTTEVAALSTAAHAGAGGTPPSLDLLVLLVLGVGAVSVALHHRLLQPRVATIVAVLAQLAAHAAAPGTTSHSDHAHGAPSPEMGVPMIAAHVVSVVVTVLALVWQEQVLLGVVRCLTLPALRAGQHAPRPAACAPAPPIRPSVLLLTAPRRGPPRGRAFVVS